MSDLQQPPPANRTLSPRRRSSRSARPTNLPIIFSPKALLLVGMLVGAVFAARAGYHAWRDSRAVIVVQPTLGGPLDDQVTLEFFEFDERIAAASPTRRLATVDAAGERTTVGREQVPGEALVRVRSARHGIAFGVVKLGADTHPISLGSPVAYTSRVVFRAITESADRPMVGARVLALGGGPRGVVLGEGITDSEGTFVIDSISDTVLFVTFRVLSKGHAVFEHEHRVGEELTSPFRPEPSAAVFGVVDAPPEVDLSGCEIRVVRVPGVTAKLAATGAFELEHLPPPPLRCRLVVANLPAGWTHRTCFATAGARGVVLTIEKSVTVTGVVADAVSSKIVKGASVYHENGPSGVEVVECDSSGHYVIGRVPHGVVRLSADRLVEKRWLDVLGRRRRKQLLQGYFDLQITADTTRIEDVVLFIRP